MKFVLLWKEHGIILQIIIIILWKWLDSSIFLFSFFFSSLGLNGISNTKESCCFLICWHTKKDGSLFWVKREKGKGNLNMLISSSFVYRVMWGCQGLQVLHHPLEYWNSWDFQRGSKEKRSVNSVYKLSPCSFCQEHGRWIGQGLAFTLMDLMCLFICLFPLGRVSQVLRDSPGAKDCLASR